MWRKICLQKKKIDWEQKCYRWRGGRPRVSEIPPVCRYGAPCLSAARPGDKNIKIHLPLHLIVYSFSRPGNTRAHRPTGPLCLWVDSGGLARWRCCQVLLTLQTGVCCFTNCCLSYQRWFNKLLYLQFVTYTKQGWVGEEQSGVCMVGVARYYCQLRYHLK